MDLHKKKYKKNILITGCSSGIGLHVARDMKEIGWNVIASCRKESDCKIMREKYGFLSTVINYDNEESITSGLNYSLEKTNGRIDILFNNGAYGLPSLVEDIPVDSLRNIFETNFFGWHSLTKGVIPYMKEQGSGRIIQNSSILGFMALKYRGAYTATKYALEGLSDTLRLELKDSNIKIILIQPGPITTKFRENSYIRFIEDIKWDLSPNRLIYSNIIIPRLEAKNPKKTTFELLPDAVSKSVIHACISNNPKTRYRITWATLIMMYLKRLLTDKIFDRIADRL
ncbi:MAG: SDR family NAD(P)-dependent oxidoreductase [Hyphomicrobiales bacterium]|jgi:short-subunit dehydrogenase|nr:SDR family NAD(P)-dependent oxidoreductase [Hyphomicrobiales bacterium]|tara:strand:+ start:1613 stop:2467 length:855 start_codon:yes stop_codon:yes gene_type:complete